MFNKLSLLSIPFDDNSSLEKGPAKAPALIKQVLAQGSLNKGTELGIELGDNPRWCDGGEVTFSSLHHFNDEIVSACNALLENNSLVLSLGGDHSVSYPLIKSYAEHFEPLNILHIDAHSDLYDSFKGNRFSNACPFARVMEEGLAKRLVQIGIRTLNAHQVSQIHRFGVECHEMRDWPLDKPLYFDGPVYISLDVDGIDPAFAPGVSHREPGGLSTREVINLIHRIDAPVVGADIVEFNPNKDIDHLTSQLCAKLVKELAGKILSDV
ncbi:agmatinase [Thalassotalea atypica]|uniref:agmatinase n=1 Tax=Thalassotalea atypica TaxID=2054316 RepID=UPI0025729A84|nr:agmatinase [Thalassotalea atypica]